MAKKYAVNNFMAGTIVTVDTQEEAVQLFWQNVLNFIKLQHGNNMYFEVEHDGEQYTFKNQNADILSEHPLTQQEILDLFNNGEIPLSIRPNIPAPEQVDLGS